MLTHLGFSAWIVSDGKPLPEYLVAVDEKAHRVSCWIPSEEGQAFTVYWRDHGGKIDTCAFITLDGFVVPGRFLFGTGVACRQGVRTGPSTERPFVFQKVEEREGETFQTATKDMGMVTLRIKRVERVASKPANPLQKIPETRLGKRKMGELCVGFGEEKQAYDQSAYTWSVKAHDKNTLGADKPSTYVSFVFRYRSREFLQTQGIIPEVEEIPVTPKRAPIRRIASAPATSIAPPEAPSMITPSPSPPKKQKQNSTAFNFLRKGPRRLRRPSDIRRTVSWKVITTKPEGFPGQGMLRFDEDLVEKDGEDDLQGAGVPAEDGIEG